MRLGNKKFNSFCRYCAESFVYLSILGNIHAKKSSICAELILRDVYVGNVGFCSVLGGCV